MTDAELFSFMDSFRNLARVFPLRGDEHELTQVGASYFRAMRRFPLPAVQAGAEVWLQKGERFPKPAQWMESIPKRTAAVEELRALSVEDTREYLRAEKLRYEDAPCHCASCQQAGVTGLPLRFVPDEDRALIGDRAVTRGHWAHGQELARYHASVKAFWLAMFERFGADTPKAQRRIKQSFEQRMSQVYQEPARTDAGRSDMEPLVDR